MSVERWSGAEARTALASPDLDRRLGPLNGVAAVAVDLDDDPGDDIADALTRHPVVAIGLGTAAGPGWDVRTSDPTEVITGVELAPNAAVVATQVLRGHADRPVEAGLLLESLAYATLQRGPEFLKWLEARGRRVRSDDQERVRVDEGDGNVRVVLDRPRLRNLDARMRDELVDVLRALAFDDRPIRLEGAGPAFCGRRPGGVRHGRRPHNRPPHPHQRERRPFLVAVADCVTAVVHGACVGAGVELAAFCRHVVADPDTRFRLPETHMGLLPGAGGTVSIPARIGRHRTLEWLLTNREIDAGTARAWASSTRSRVERRTELGRTAYQQDAATRR
ncbi:MAG: enoyl-CoA hydratase/isomerase family protein [Acidimicrobiales bacterium]